MQKQTHKSVSQRFNKAKRPEHKLQVVSDWVNVWEERYLREMEQLRHAVYSQDYDSACVLLRLLREDSEKKFTAAKNMLKKTEMLLVAPTDKTNEPEDDVHKNGRNPGLFSRILKRVKK